MLPQSLTVKWFPQSRSGYAERSPGWAAPASAAPACPACSPSAGEAHSCSGAAHNPTLSVTHQYSYIFSHTLSITHYRTHAETHIVTCSPSAGEACRCWGAAHSSTLSIAPQQLYIPHRNIHKIQLVLLALPQQVSAAHINTINHTPTIIQSTHSCPGAEHNPASSHTDNHTLSFTHRCGLCSFFYFSKQSTQLPRCWTQPHTITHQQ